LAEASGNHLPFLVAGGGNFCDLTRQPGSPCAIRAPPSKRRVMENSNALDHPVSDRCRAAWRSPGGIGATPAQLSLVRQLRSAPWQCGGLPFHQSPSVRGDGVRDSRALLSKSALSLGTPAPSPHQLTRRSRGTPSVGPSVLLDGFGPAPAGLFLPSAAASRAAVSLRRRVLLRCAAAVDVSAIRLHHDFVPLAACFNSSLWCAARISRACFLLSRQECNST
jgi:hypothetical protein